MPLKESVAGEAGAASPIEGSQPGSPGLPFAMKSPVYQLEVQPQQTLNGMAQGIMEMETGIPLPQLGPTAEQVRQLLEEPLVDQQEAQAMEQQDTVSLQLLEIFPLEANSTDFDQLDGWGDAWNDPSPQDTSWDTLTHLLGPEAHLPDPEAQVQTDGPKPKASRPRSARPEDQQTRQNSEDGNEAVGVGGLVGWLLVSLVCGGRARAQVALGPGGRGGRAR